MAVILFEKTLVDLVKGIRSSKRDTGLYISSCIAEIKTELNSTDTFTKSNALQKMTFLQMMGYNMSWASFATVEVMSSHRFAHKRIGYLAACQAFDQDTEVVLLTTNLLKKELRGALSMNHNSPSNGIYEAGLAINCVSNIVTEDLARELLPEMTSLTSHPQPYIRKKAIMCLFKLFVKYPQALRLTFDQIRKALDDSNSAVVSCAVNVITELSDKNPRNYLHLAPAFFNLLTSSSNNWMLIKVVKLLGSLVSEEPRLARKLLEPLAGIVKNTQAKSLLYEAVYTITLALPYCKRSDGSMPPNVPDIVQLCSQTLQIFVQEEDQNLKYLGLVGLNSLTGSHPKLLSSSSGGSSSHRDLILQCLSDDDVTIRTRALDLLAGMASRKNLKELIEQLLPHVDMAEGPYKADLVGKIVFMCRMEKYALISDFQWYVATLVRLAHIRGIEKVHGPLLKGQMMDVALRVLPVRKYAVGKMARILLDQRRRRMDAREEFVIADVLSAAAWIVGEYAHLIWDASADDDMMIEIDNMGPYHAIVSALLHPHFVTTLDAETQAVYLQSSMKVFAAACYQKKASADELEACCKILFGSLPIFAESHHKEVQERAFSFQQLLASLNLKPSNSTSGNIVPSDLNGDTKLESNDLLTLTGSVPSSTFAKPSFSSTSIAQRCQMVAETLNYLLTPNPMKPIGAKAQRKKRLAPPPLERSLDDGIDNTVFESILQEEKRFRHGGITMDVVNFTEQRSIKPPEEKNNNTPNFTSSISSQLDTLSNDIPTTQQSFQNSNGSSQPLQQPSMYPRINDPFYLNTGMDSTGQNKAQTSNKFGMIQLVSDDENVGNEKSKRKKSKKKDRKKKKVDSLNDADLNVFTDEQNALENTVLESEDDDDDDDTLDIFAPNQPHANKKGQNKTGKEFASLANVDLTAPLREDEVMPINTHRKVPERRQIFAETKPTKKKKKDKKEKKNKKKDKKKSQQAVEENSPDAAKPQTGDLLDFGGLFSSNTNNAPVEPSVTTAINSAFDDLLGLEQPSLESPAVSNQKFLPNKDIPNVSTTKASGKRPWMKCTIKAKSAKANNIIEWKKIKLDFRAYSSKSRDGCAASITVRLTNSTLSSPLQDVSLSLDSEERFQISLGDVGPNGQSVESQSKTGPFQYPSDGDSNLEIRGKISASGSTVPVRIVLPATMNLSPVSNRTQVCVRIISYLLFHSVSDFYTV